MSSWNPALANDASWAAESWCGAGDDELWNPTLANSARVGQPRQRAHLGADGRKQ